MKALKATLAVIIGLAISGCMWSMALDALDHQYEHSPRPPLSHIKDMCEQGDQKACDIYDDMTFFGEQQ